MTDPNPAYESLRHNQRQLDFDGCEVGVSRQALEEILAAFDVLSGTPPALKPERATEMPMGDCGLTINVGRDGTWLHFTAKSGMSASINMDVMASERGSIIGRALKDWCAERQEQAATIKDAGS